MSAGESGHVSRELKVPRGSDPPGPRLASLSGLENRELVGMLKQVSLVLPAPLPGHLLPPQACQRLQTPAVDIEVFPDLGLTKSSSGRQHKTWNPSPGSAGLSQQEFSFGLTVTIDLKLCSSFFYNVLSMSFSQKVVAFHVWRYLPLGGLFWGWVGGN